jgi:DNA polymerase-3 subunit gamma/tau
VKFVLATTDPQKLPITILSRCLRFSLTRLLPDQISTHLEKILQAESIEADESAIMRIARAADGSMRDGLSLLDQAIAFGGGSLKDADVASMLGSIDHVHIAAILDALSRSDANALMDIVNDLVLQSRNLETALDELAEAMHRIALIHAAPDFRDPERADWDSLVEYAAQISPEDAQLYYQIAITGRRDLGLAPDPRTGLEMTLLRMLAFRPEETGVAGAVPVAKSTAANTDTTSAGSPQAQQTAKTRTASGGNEAAKATRAAFDAMHQSTPARPTQSSELELESEPEPELELELELEPRHDPAPESKVEAEKVAVSASEEPEKYWSGLQASLDLSGAVREFARNLQFESADEDRWRFLVPDTLKHLGSKSVVQSLQSALSSRLGHAVMLDLHTASEPVKSVAAATERAEINRMSEAERAIDEDSTVQEIKEKFGAKIIPDSIQPIQ